MSRRERINSWEDYDDVTMPSKRHKAKKNQNRKNKKVKSIKKRPEKQQRREQNNNDYEFNSKITF